ncbi:hypothetical protein J6590_053973 [Homalodisca vitripennis]|nr:hypothetical protein J6590_053973 [Homalodisca vitripennis]
MEKKFSGRSSPVKDETDWYPLNTPGSAASVGEEGSNTTRWQFIDADIGAWHRHRRDCVTPAQTPFNCRYFQLKPGRLTEHDK